MKPLTVVVGNNPQSVIVTKTDSWSDLARKAFQQAAYDMQPDSWVLRDGDGALLATDDGAKRVGADALPYYAAGRVPTCRVFLNQPAGIGA